jgi:hypothetical protein
MSRAKHPVRAPDGGPERRSGKTASPEAATDERRGRDAELAQDEPLAPEGHAEDAGGRGEGLYFYGVVRAKGWRIGRASRSTPDVQRLRFRDIEALVSPTAFEMPVLDEAHVRAHQRAVEAVLRTDTVLPAPWGVVFRGRRQLITLLQEQYLVLDEGLS